MPEYPSEPAERIIVALDGASTAQNLATIAALRGRARWYKVGMRQFYAGAQPVLEAIRESGARLFLDLKLHDIPNTVATAIESLAPIAPDLLTIHASGGTAMVRAARAMVDDRGLPTRLLAVTVLTSLSSGELAEIGLPEGPETTALRWGAMSVAAGAHGLVCSGHEASALRAALVQGGTPNPLLVTPGIRLPSDAAGDQQRIMTPAAAVEAGASHLVIGRPIIAAADPARAFDAALANLTPSSAT